MTDIDVQTETDSPRGWTFTVTIAQHGTQRICEVALSWSDYDHWSHGRIAPERVVAAAVRYAADNHGLDELGSTFDCARIRRRWPQIDRELPARL